MSRESIIGIMSDSHDNLPALRKAMQVFTKAGCSLVIHAGDYVAPFTAREFNGYSGLFAGVFGNNDGERHGLTTQYAAVGGIYGAPHELVHAGAHIVVMHEPFYLDEYLAHPDVDVIIYGHTHKPDIRPGEPVVINPGECCGWVSGVSTVVILDLDTMHPELIELP